MTSKKGSIYKVDLASIRQRYKIQIEVELKEEVGLLFEFDISEVLNAFEDVKVLALYEYIIDIDFHISTELGHKDSVDEPLISGASILEAERHNSSTIYVSACDEQGPMLGSRGRGARLPKCGEVAAPYYFLVLVNDVFSMLMELKADASNGDIEVSTWPASKVRVDQQGDRNRGQ
ncbi:hypothetical protein ACLOJK_030005 [Asimina triloba]